jgi:hypothetical protein
MSKKEVSIELSFHDVGKVLDENGEKLVDYMNCK